MKYIRNTILTLIFLSLFVVPYIMVLTHLDPNIKSKSVEAIVILSFYFVSYALVIYVTRLCKKFNAWFDSKLKQEEEIRK